MPSLYFWRDQTGNEIDLIVESALKTTLVEIKAGKTVTNNFFKALTYWSELTDSSGQSYLIYAGERGQTRSRSQIISWQASGDLIKKINY